ncbi:unnamed protein product, partial [Mesorhabditis belari]|uniref:Uncharacterized protein n=1 Tax=Mesorhabditis belari TaxID=2138241 RepID=A0AAF3FFN9_9BILA
MFRKPIDDDDDNESRIVRAKPLDPKYAKALGIKGRDFVRGSNQSQAEFYGQQNIESGPSTSQQSTVLTEDQRNKIHAKILKAELKGDTDLVKSLKRKLDGENDEVEGRTQTKLLIKKDKHGNIVPATNVDMRTDKFAKGSSRMKREYEKDQSLSEMVREEKTGTAEQQLRLFERSLVKSSKIKRHDEDESVDDIAEMQKGRKREDERDERKEKQRQRRVLLVRSILGVIFERRSLINGVTWRFDRVER